MSKKVKKIKKQKITRQRRRKETVAERKDRRRRIKEDQNRTVNAFRRELEEMEKASKAKAEARLAVPTDTVPATPVDATKAI